MFSNYCKIAWRNLIRNKAFSVISIAGLALGICCSLLIVLWVKDERSVDAFHANGKQLYQVYEQNYFDGKMEAGYSTQGLLAQELKKTIPEIQYAASFENTASPGSANTLEAGDKINKMWGAFAGADIFNMFSYPLLQGNKNKALDAPNSIAISRKMAEMFFGSPETAMGKLIRFDNKEELQVTAVFENIPTNSSQQFDFLRSWADFVQQNKWVNNWSNTSPVTFVQLRKDAGADKVAAKIKDFIYRYQEKNAGSVTALALQPFPEKYLHANLKSGYPDGGRIEYVHLFTIVAIFILLIACINFMNLATARSVRRAKEVGLRKVIGAIRSSLIIQFIGEAILLTFFAFVFALLLTLLLLPAFNQLTGKQLFLPVSNVFFWLALLGLLVLTGIVAGSYPALFLSSLQPVKVLKGALRFGWGTTFFRKSLVVFQFGLSVVLIVCMIVVYQQVNFIQTKNIGYDRDNLVYIPVEGELISKYELFKAEAGKLPGITSVSKMRNTPTVIEHHTGSIAWPGKDPSLVVSFADAVVGYDFVTTMKLTLQQGRDFSRNFGTDSTGYLLNETAVKKMGLQNPLGQTITWGNRPGKVIGVLRDFHFNSMHQAIEPLIVRHDEQWGWGTILVRVKSGQTSAALAGLEKTFKSLNPKFPFTYQFSDQEYTKLYQGEQVVSKLADYFAFLAIFISCLGLFGLATFSASQRTKEIGVRKVLGAGVGTITRMLVQDFTRPVLVAILLAVPLSWWGMNKWLQQYEYRIDINWWIFLLAACIVIVIAIFTVSFQSIKAAIANPVKSLRRE